MNNPAMTNTAFAQYLVRQKCTMTSARISNTMLERIPLHSFATSMLTLEDERLNRLVEKARKQVKYSACYPCGTHLKVISDTVQNRARQRHH